MSVTLFDILRWGCKTHPRDVIYNYDDPQYSVYFENVYDDAYYDTLKELVEDQGCNWKWYCYEFNLNPKDEKWGRYDY